MHGRTNMNAPSWEAGSYDGSKRDRPIGVAHGGLGQAGTFLCAITMAVCSPLMSVQIRSRTSRPQLRCNDHEWSSHTLRERRHGTILPQPSSVSCSTRVCTAPPPRVCILWRCSHHSPKQTWQATARESNWRPHQTYLRNNAEGTYEHGGEEVFEQGMGRGLAVLLAFWPSLLQ